MGINVRTFVIKILLLISIIPLFIFAFIFFGQTFKFFMNNDTENIRSVLEREQKYLEYLVEVNIKEMLVVSTSDNIKTRRLDETVEVFERIMRVRNDFHKMKFVRKDGYTVEVLNGGGYMEYTKTPLGYMERTFVENGEYAMYSSEEGGGRYVVFSAPLTTEEGIEAVILGYLPADKMNFITQNINLNAVGNIYMQDSRDNVFLRHGDDFQKGKNDIELKIKNTDWILAAKIDYSYFENIIYENILVKLVMFLVLVVILTVPFAVYSANYVGQSIGEVVKSIKSLEKIEDNNKGFFKIQEHKDFKRSFNKMIDILNNNIRFDNKIYVDKLTGLYNKMYIEERLSRDLYEREGENTYFLMMDISHQETNKYSSSSLKWDVAISEIGELIRDSIRFGDIPVRFDEDKFLIILRGIDNIKAMNISSRIRDLVENMVVIPNKLEINFTVNMGIAKCSGDIYKTISICERALYDSKASRDNKIGYRES